MAARRPTGAAALRLHFAPPPHAQNYQRIFSGTLCFGQPRTAAWFDADAFKQPVRRDRDALQSFLRATPGNVVGPSPERAQRQRGSAWCCSGPVPNGLIWPSLRSATCR
jgi:hypothetical protein